MSPVRATLTAAGAVLAAATVICLVADVRPVELTQFGGYQLAFVVAPGCGLAWLLLGRRSAIELVAVGWALGYALEISAYIAVSFVDHRNLFAFYPLLALPLLGGLLLRRRPGLARLRVPPREAFAAAAVGVLALLFVAAGLFTVSPLPWKAVGVSYFTDLPWHLTIIGEAKHHWPLADATASGVRLWYHVWSHLDMAATSNVTGLEPALLLLRLFPVALSILVVLQLVLVGRRLLGRAWAGPLTAALAVGVGELDSQAGSSYPFLGYFGLGWWLSPSFLLGLAFFLPALLLVCELIRAPAPIRAAWPRWTVVALLLIGAEGAKATTIPVLAGGVALYLAFRLWTTRRLEPAAAAAFAVACGVFLLFYATVYRHSAGAGLAIDPLRAMRMMPQFAQWRNDFGSVPGAVYWSVAAVLAPFASYGALAALPTLVARDRRHLGSTELLLLCTLAAGFVPFFAAWQFGASQLFFSHYGFIAACVLGAAGLLALAESAHRERPGALAAAAVFGAAWLVALIMLELVALPWFSTAPLALKLAAPGAGVFVVAALLGARARLRGAEAGRTIALGTTAALVVALALWKADVVAYWNVPYLLLGAVAIGLVAVALRTTARGRAGIWLTLSFTVLGFGLLDQPLDYVPNSVLGIPGKRFVAYGGGGQRMSHDLYEGLLWLRAHSSPGDAIAADNYDEPVGRRRYASYYYYSAFAERRVFVEGWLFSSRTHELGGTRVLEGRATPFPERLRLNKAVFVRGDPDALDVLVHDYGVRYLLVDRLHGFATPRVRGLGRLVFDNQAVSIYRVAAG